MAHIHVDEIEIQTHEAPKQMCSLWLTWFLWDHVMQPEQLLVSIVVSIPACHAGDRGSIPRRGEWFFS